MQLDAISKRRYNISPSNMWQTNWERHFVGVFAGPFSFSPNPALLIATCAHSILQRIQKRSEKRFGIAGNELNMSYRDWWQTSKKRWFTSRDVLRFGQFTRKVLVKTETRT
jgi:hypothetical protein